MHNLAYLQMIKKANKGKKIFEELLLNPNLVRYIRHIRNKYKIPFYGFSNLKTYSEWRNKTELKQAKMSVKKQTISLNEKDKPVILNTKKYNTSISLFFYDLYKILKKYRLSMEWLPYIDDYVCFEDKNITPQKPYEVYLNRYLINNVIIDEKVNLIFGSTMRIRDLTSKIKGVTTWKNSIEPLQKLMQGYNEKAKRPSKSKTKTQRKLYLMQKEGKKDWEITRDYERKYIPPATTRKNISLYKKKIKPNS